MPSVAVYRVTLGGIRYCYSQIVAKLPVGGTLARRSNETRIRVGRYRRVRLGWKDTLDAARPRRTFPTNEPCATGKIEVWAKLSRYMRYLGRYISPNGS
jgi:hypothetical protein